jgi:hypothetical protein
MAERPSRYSVQITLDQELLKVKGKSHDLCCAWGFTWSNSKDPIYNIVGWTSCMCTQLNSDSLLTLSLAENSHTKTIAPIKTIAWNENYSITASEYGRKHGGECPNETGHFDITDTLLNQKSWLTRPWSQCLSLQVKSL